MSDLSRIRRAGVPVLVLALAAGLSGCSGSAELPSGVIDADAATAEYLDESQNWTLPEGREWPDDPGLVAVEPDGQAHLYGEDYGRVAATLYWYCAWGDEFLTAGPGADRDAALDQLLLITTTPMYQLGFPADQKELFDGVTEDLVAGDYTFFTQFVQNTCRELLDGPPAP